MSEISSLTLKQLRALAAVAKHGSMTAAARSLLLTPPAIHSQIKMLEDVLGATLLERNADSAGSQLTPSGVALLETADRVEAILSQGLQQVRAIERGELGRITLGVVSTAKYFAPRLVKTLGLLHPDITIDLIVGNRDMILDNIDLGTVDLAIMGRPPRVPLVEATPLGAHPHAIVAPPEHPLAAQPALSWADLRGEAFIAREAGSGTRLLMQRYLGQLAESDEDEMPFLQMSSNETIKQAVIAGLGIAFLSLHTVVAELDRGTLIVLNTPNAPVMRHWFMVNVAGRPLSPAAQRILASVRNLEGSFLPVLPAPWA